MFKNFFFITITLNNWTSLLIDFPESKYIIFRSLRYFNKVKGVNIYGFVILRDHLHLIVEIPINLTILQFITNLKSYTSKQILILISEIESEYINHFNSSRADRKNKIWKLNSQFFPILNIKTFNQKLNYIHRNPCKGNYKSVSNSEDYLYSSAYSYLLRKSRFSFLTLYGQEAKTTLS
ncbi:MAG: hypothetical protein HKN51_10705 [Saprospiraceae bacterium]|nr:transposase [Bacteroidia bacterium]NNE15437.1 hypothetical protein [Saprospiraceae bacterium]